MILAESARSRSDEANSNSAKTLAAIESKILVATRSGKYFIVFEDDLTDGVIQNLKECGYKVSRREMPWISYTISWGKK